MDELIDFKKRFLKNGELVSIPKKESYKGSVEKVGVAPDSKRVGPASCNLEYG